MRIVKQIFGLIFFLFLTLLLLALIMPPLLSDLAHAGDTPVPASEYKVEKAECTNYVYVVAFCNIELTRRSGQGEPTSIYSLHLGPMGGETVVPVRSAKDPTYIGTTIGRDAMVNRSIAFVIAAIFVIGGLIGTVIGMIRGRRVQPA